MTLIEDYELDDDRPIVNVLLDEYKKLELELIKLRELVRWIPVEERLPEQKTPKSNSCDWGDFKVSDTVLVDWLYCDDSAGTEIRATAKAYIFGTTWTNQEDGTECEADDCAAPTVWRPLPEPPEAK